MTDIATNAESHRFAANEIRQFVERDERLAADAGDIAQLRKENMDEAKSRGYEAKALRQLIALRKMDANDRAEAEAILEMYKSALGM